MGTDDDFYNRVNAKRISSRQIDELNGLARGLLADGKIDQSEVECLQKWLAANVTISNQPLIRTLYKRIDEILRDGIVDADESSDLFGTLNHFVHRDFELGETLKATSLPLNIPEPDLEFLSRRYCFTGTFTFGQRKQCEQAVTDRGGIAGSLIQKTQFLVIGTYATESWKHSSFGNKIRRRPYDRCRNHQSSAKGFSVLRESCFLANSSRTQSGASKNVSQRRVPLLRS